MRCVDGSLLRLLARAALSLARGLLRVLKRVEHLEETGDGGVGGAGRAAGSGGLGDGQLDIGVLARAALGLLAGSLLALQLALGLGAVGGLDALLEAGELLADGRHLGSGASQVVWQRAGLQTDSHLGQPSFSQVSLGQRMVQTGFSQWTVHLAQVVSSHCIWHLGRSQTGWQTAGQAGSSHCHLHWGWHLSAETATMANKARMMRERICGCKRARRGAEKHAQAC